MDTSLKKLWARRKSKGNDGRKDSGVSSLRKSESTEQTQHSTSPSPRSAHIRTISSSHGAPQLALVGKAQPTSGGALLPRPSTSRSRPATDGSGSMLNAVNRAADDVVRAEQEFQHSAEQYTRDHIHPKTPRYIDIFSLSSSNSPNPRPGYNEDVAERNLDLGRVALEGTHYQYVPSSKYQEEVAARNALPSLPASPRDSPTVRERWSDDNQSPNQQRGVRSALGDYPQSPQRLQDRSLSRQSQDSPRSTQQHFRHFRNMSRESQRAPELSSQGENAAQSPHRPRPPRLSNGSNKAGATYPSPESPARHRGRGSGDSQVHERRPDALSRYQLSASEVTLIKSTEQSSHAQSHEYSVHSPSNLSSPSSVKRAINLPSRTIMDLTDDDAEVLNDSSPLSKYHSSPSVEHAKVDEGPMVPPPVISRSHPDELRTQSDFSQSANLSPVTSKSPPTAEVSQSFGPAPEPASEQLNTKKTPINRHLMSSFTPIMTLASASPRTSVVMVEPAASIAVPDKQQDITNEVNHNLDEPIPAIDGGPSSDDASPDSQRRGEETTIPSQDAEVAPIGTSSTDSSAPPPQRSDATMGERMHSTQDSGSSSTSGPHIPLSSGNAEPGLDVISAAGVITRDFATITTKLPLSIVLEDPELDEISSIPPTAIGTNTRSRKNSPRERNTNGHVQVNTSNQPAFDEKEFAQKQAEAREALVRLQLSLNENFLTQPIAATAVHSNKSSPSKHIYSFSDGRPAAPSNIFSLIRESSPVPVVEEAEADNSPAPKGPEASYHKLRTVTQEDTPVAAPNEKLLSSKAKVKTDHKPDKGSKSVEAELNGPGPSIVNEAPKQPLRLPPLLPPADDPFRQRYAVPPSPGEISLSNFPIPVSSPRHSVQRPTVISSADAERNIPRPSSQHATLHSLASSSPPAVRERVIRRQASTNSQSSSTSQFSIPYHMIPDRSSSRRDLSVMVDGE
ncbi:hypothetical protein H2200_012871 [Cladophialophora chaetospira]|uniref:Uncharacterized protein n=1 Tax=Cladophialophora chaetospira TaxID=386627 RepID=A0AA39CBZ3_9EURO|nr:hypothetical protein H2200_012871 [Cladophialophora chaetospira]